MNLTKNIINDIIREEIKKLILFENLTEKDKKEFKSMESFRETPEFPDEWIPYYDKCHQLYVSPKQIKDIEKAKAACFEIGVRPPTSFMKKVPKGPKVPDKYLNITFKDVKRPNSRPFKYFNDKFNIGKKLCGPGSCRFLSLNQEDWNNELRHIKSGRYKPTNIK